MLSSRRTSSRASLPFGGRGSVSSEESLKLISFSVEFSMVSKFSRDLDLDNSALLSALKTRQTQIEGCGTFSDTTTQEKVLNNELNLQVENVKKKI